MNASPLLPLDVASATFLSADRRDGGDDRAVA